MRLRTRAEEGERAVRSRGSPRLGREDSGRVSRCRLSGGVRFAVVVASVSLARLLAASPGEETPAAGSASPAAPELAPSRRTFDVRDAGAAGDGKTSDTRAIRAAIEACAAAGGGQVLFPPGEYLSGTVKLASGVTLRLEAGARLVGTSELGEYEHFPPPSEAPEARNPRWHRALVLFDGVEDAAIVGPGTIDGNKVFDPRGEEKMRGPHTIVVGASRRIRIEDLWIRDSANYAVLIEFSEEVEVRRAKVTGGWDGVHFRGWRDRPCRDLKIVGCEFYTGDDSIAGRYAEDVIVRDCVVNSSCNGVRIIGPLRRFVFEDCLFYGPGIHPHRTSGRRNMLSGIILQPGAWDPCEGPVEDGLIACVTMRGVASPVTVWLKRPGNSVDRVTVSRLSATEVYSAAASVESWTETPVGRVVFRDCDFEFAGADVDGKGGEGSAGSASASPKFPGVDARELPVWGFYARNAADLRLEDARFGRAGEGGTGLLFDRVERLALDGVRVSGCRGGTDPIAFEGVGRVELGEGGVSAAEPEYVALEAEAEQGVGEGAAGRALSAKVTVRGRARGVADVELGVGGRARSRWVWLEPGREKTVVFGRIEVPADGPLELRAGGLVKVVSPGP